MTKRSVKFVFFISLLTAANCARHGDSLPGEESQQTPLQLATSRGSYKQIKYLLRKTNYVDKKYVISLLKRVDGGNKKQLTVEEKELFRVLLKKRLQNRQLVKDYILHLVITSSSSSKILEWLIKEREVYLVGYAAILGKREENSFEVSD